MIPYGRQSIDEDDIASVVDALRSDYLTTGPRVREFEEAFAEHCGAAHAVSCSSGTAALHLALLAAGIGPGDRVVTAPNTFLATASTALHTGAEVDFCDIEPVAATLDADRLEREWKADTKAVIAVDYAGHPAELERIAGIAHERGAILIEDACHSVGGEYAMASEETHEIGGLPFVDLTVFSFHPVKTMTTGEGGMVTTRDEELDEKLRLFRNHGMVRDRARFTCFGQEAGPLAEDGPWAYEMHAPGLNYRLTDLQCALGLSQLKKLDHFVQRRREIVDHYNQAFADLSHTEIPDHAHWHSAERTTGWHLYALRIDFDALGKSRTQVMGELKERGVGSQVHYIPLPLQPGYRERGGWRPGDFPVAEEHYRRCLSLPLWPGMEDGEVARVVEAHYRILT